MPDLHYRAARRIDLPFIIHLLTIDAIGRRFGRGAYMDQTQILPLMLGNVNCR